MTLTRDATAALSRWQATGGTQSLLSMYPHAELEPLVTAAGIAPFFARAAQACGIRCVIYHPGDDALHSRDHFATVPAPIVPTLRAAVGITLTHR